MNQPMVQPQIAVNPMNCPIGQYFNGVTCAAIVVSQGNCNGINTQLYGCVQQCAQCANRYQYVRRGVSTCVPVAVSTSSCKSVRTRRNGRVVLISNNGCNDGSTPRKIKFNRDGTIKKIKW
jgi:hypothetical protein